MKLCYLANIRLPTEKAHGVQIMKMCEAFACAGAEVELVVPTRVNDLKGEDAFAYYGVAQNFTLTYLPVPDPYNWPLGFYVQSWLFARAAASYLRGKKFDVIFGREELPLWLVSRATDLPTVWESHLGNSNFVAQQLLKRVQKLVTISQGLKDFYTGRGVPADKIVVAHDGVDLSAFAHPESKEAARARLGLPHDPSTSSGQAKIALYIGRLDGWKGVETFFEASKLLPDVLTAVIGGEWHQVKEFAKKYPAIIFLGYRPYKELPGNQQAADVLVLPNTGRDEVSAKFTSPLKLFTYLASGIPVVVSDLPSIREVVSEREVFLVQPDDSQALANGITHALVGGAPRAAAAQALVQAYTWEARAKNILGALAYLA